MPRPSLRPILEQEKIHEFKCNGCDEDIARAAGAEIEVLPLVQKTSNLILSFTVLIIPHTLAATTLHALAVGDDVNLEVDLMARYVARLLHKS